jgi:uncharacterized protein involved in exopolysaccharide biosynthesis
MDYRYLYKVIKANIVWWTLLPIAMMILVYLGLSLQKDEYKSATMLYTGYATGTSLESTNEFKRVDYFSVNVAYNNALTLIQSRQSLEETAFRLFVDDLFDDNINIEDEKDTVEINKIKAILLSDKFDDQDLTKLPIVISDSKRNYVAKLYLLAIHGEMSEWLEDILFESSSSPYSVKTIQENLTAKRPELSDMIELSYTSFDPGIAQKTLVVLLDVFTNKQKQIKESDSDQVVEYYRSELEKTENLLQLAEDNLKTFKSNNGVVNFTSQTEYVATQREEIQREYDTELMKLRASQSAIEQIESQLNQKSAGALNSGILSTYRNKLSTLNDAKVRAEIKGENAKVESIAADIAKTESLMQAELKKQSRRSSSTSNVSTKGLLDQWLSQTIIENESKARMKVFEQRLASINRDYNRYAPVGAELTQLEREVQMLDQKYRKLDNELTKAQTLQSDAELTNAIELLDYPNKPYEAEKSKKFLLVIISGFLGFSLIIVYLFSKVYLDNSLRNPGIVKEKINLPVLGAFPKLIRKRNIAIIKEKLLSQIIWQLRSMVKSNNGQPRKTLVTICSVQNKEGKSTFFKSLFSLFNAADKNNIEFYEQSSLVDGNLELKMIERSDFIILVIDSSRNLTESDQYHIEKLLKMKKPVYIVLNKLSRYEYDSFLGK